MSEGFDFSNALKQKDKNTINLDTGVDFSNALDNQENNIKLDTGFDFSQNFYTPHSSNYIINKDEDGEDVIAPKPTYEPYNTKLDRIKTEINQHLEKAKALNYKASIQKKSSLAMKYEKKSEEEQKKYEDLQKELKKSIEGVKFFKQVVANAPKDFNERQQYFKQKINEAERNKLDNYGRVIEPSYLDAKFFKDLEPQLYYSNLDNLDTTQLEKRYVAKIVKSKDKEALNDLKKHLSKKFIKGRQKLLNKRRTGLGEFTQGLIGGQLKTSPYDLYLKSIGAINKTAEETDTFYGLAGQLTREIAIMVAITLISKGLSTSAELPAVVNVAKKLKMTKPLLKAGKFFKYFSAADKYKTGEILANIEPITKRILANGVGWSVLNEISKRNYLYDKSLGEMSDNFGKKFIDYSAYEVPLLFEARPLMLGTQALASAITHLNDIKEGQVKGAITDFSLISAMNMTLSLFGGKLGKKVDVKKTDKVLKKIATDLKTTFHNYYPNLPEDKVEAEVFKYITKTYNLSPYDIKDYSEFLKNPMTLILQRKMLREITDRANIYKNNLGLSLPLALQRAKTEIFNQMKELPINKSNKEINKFIESLKNKGINSSLDDITHTGREFKISTLRKIKKVISEIDNDEIVKKTPKGEKYIDFKLEEKDADNVLFSLKNKKVGEVNIGTKKKPKIIKYIINTKNIKTEATETQPSHIKKVYKNIQLLTDNFEDANKAIKKIKKEAFASNIIPIEKDEEYFKTIEQKLKDILDSSNIPQEEHQSIIDHILKNTDIYMKNKVPVTGQYKFNTDLSKNNVVGFLSDSVNPKAKKELSKIIRRFVKTQDVGKYYIRYDAYRNPYLIFSKSNDINQIKDVINAILKEKGKQRILKAVVNLSDLSTAKNMMYKLDKFLDIINRELPMGKYTPTKLKIINDLRLIRYGLAEGVLTSQKDIENILNFSLLKKLEAGLNNFSKLNRSQLRTLERYVRIFRDKAFKNVAENIYRRTVNDFFKTKDIGKALNEIGNDNDKLDKTVTEFADSLSQVILDAPSHDPDVAKLSAITLYKHHNFLKRLKDAILETIVGFSEYDPKVAVKKFEKSISHFFTNDYMLSKNDFFRQMMLNYDVFDKQFAQLSSKLFDTVFPELQKGKKLAGLGKIDFFTMTDEELDNTIRNETGELVDLTPEQYDLLKLYRRNWNVLQKFLLPRMIEKMYPIDPENINFRPSNKYMQIPMYRRYSLKKALESWDDEFKKAQQFSDGIIKQYDTTPLKKKIDTFINRASEGSTERILKNNTELINNNDLLSIFGTPEEQKAFTLNNKPLEHWLNLFDELYKRMGKAGINWQYDEDVMEIAKQVKVLDFPEEEFVKDLVKLKNAINTAVINHSELFYTRHLVNKIREAAHKINSVLNSDTAKNVSGDLDNFMERRFYDRIDELLARDLEIERDIRNIWAKQFEYFARKSMNRSILENIKNTDFLITGRQYEQLKQQALKIKNELIKQEGDLKNNVDNLKAKLKRDIERIKSDKSLSFKAKNKRIQEVKNIYQENLNNLIQTPKALKDRLYKLNDRISDYKKIDDNLRGKKLLDLKSDDYYMRDDFATAFKQIKDNLAYTKNGFLKVWDNISNWFKMRMFYMPWRILFNDVSQVMLADIQAFKEVPYAVKTQIKGLDDELYTALYLQNVFNAKSSLTKTPSALKHNIEQVNKNLPKPFKEMIKKINREAWARLTKKQKVGLVAKKIFDIITFKKVFHGLAEFSWFGDEVLRIALAKRFLDRGFSKDKTAEMVKMFMVDYDRIPTQTKRLLNRFFFVPTYKIQTLRLYKDLINEGILNKNPFMALSLIKFGLYNIAFRLFMEQVLGYTPETADRFGLFAYRYNKLNKYGEAIKTISVSNPLTDYNKYVINGFKYLPKMFTPAILLASGIFTGKDRFNRPLYNKDDTMAQKFGKFALNVLDYAFPPIQQIAPLQSKQLTKIEKLLNLIGAANIYENKKSLEYLSNKYAELLQDKTIPYSVKLHKINLYKRRMGNARTSIRKIQLINRLPLVIRIKLMHKLFSGEGVSLDEIRKAMNNQ